MKMQVGNDYLPAEQGPKGLDRMTTDTPVRKSAEMRVIELERGGEIEDILAEMFQRLPTIEAVAAELGIHRVTLSGWLRDLKARRQTRKITTVSFPDR